MGTTNLVVELMVIGVGAVAATILVVLTFFGTDWIPVEALLAFQSVVPMLAITYVLGILTDRLADTIFQKAFERESDEVVEERDAARMTILVKSPGLAEEMRYGRSRMRVVRGWTVNGVLLGLSGTIFIAVQVPAALRLKFLTFHLIASFVLTVGCLRACRRLSLKGRDKMIKAAEFLRKDSTANDTA